MPAQNMFCRYIISWKKLSTIYQQKSWDINKKHIVFYQLIRYSISNFRKFKRCYKSRIESLCLIIKKFQESYIKISNISIKTNKKYWKQMEEQLLDKISRTGFGMQCYWRRNNRNLMFHMMRKYVILLSRKSDNCPIHFHVCNVERRSSTI